MCGIFGFNWEDKRLLRRMSNTLAHRGPDDQGYFTDKNISLGHRRLSIIDLSKKAKNPIWNEKKDMCLIFNGEIYNFQEIRKELSKHRFYSNADSEVLLHAYEEYGLRFIHKLNGMFAFAIYDLKKKELIMARDRVGIKPLYYHYNPETQRFIFSSELKAILLHKEVSREINPEAIDRYLTFRYVPGLQTIFKDIKKLEPGQILILKKGKLSFKTYWHFHINESDHSEAYYTNKLLQLIETSVKRRLIADVPVGAFLSGGVDSTLITALMRKYNQKVKTFSLGFESEIDELPYARKASRVVGTDHTEIIVGTKKASLFPKIIYHLDQPLGDTAIIANYLLAELARKHVKVVLSGEGADELYGGYVQHKYMKLAESMKRLPVHTRKRFLPGLVKMMPVKLLDLFLHYPASMGETGRKRLSELIKSMHKQEDTYLQLVSLFSDEEKDQLYTDEFMQRLRTHVKSYIKTNLLPYKSILNSIIDFEFKYWLRDDILFKLDKIAMAKSLEGRVPYLDHELVEFSATIPHNLKIKGNTEKYILRKAAAKVIPKEFAYRKKHAFYMPVNAWFEKEIKKIKDNLFDEKIIKKRAYFKYPYVQKIIKGNLKSKFFYDKQLISLMVLELWHRIFIDQKNLEKPILKLDKLIA